MRSISRAALVAVLVSLCSSGAAFGQGPNRIQNGSFELSGNGGGTLAASWQTFGAGYVRALSSPPWDRPYALRLTQDGGAIQRVTLNQSIATPVRLSVRVRGDNIANLSTDKYGATLDCKVAFADGSFAWCPVTMKTKNVGTFDWKWVGYNTSNLNPSHVPVRWIDVRLRMGAVSGTAWFDSVAVEEWYPTHNGLVTFMFDDGFASTYAKAYPILSSYGFVGTQAPVVNYIGSSSIFMTLSQLRTLQNSGWSTVSHTVSHANLTTLPLVELNDELYWSERYLDDNGFAVDHIALSFGAYDGRVITRAQAQLYDSVRSTDRGLNPTGVFPYNIYSQGVTTSTTVHDVRAWLAHARDMRAWLILVFHEIDRPNGVYTTTSSLFRSIVEAVDESGLQVVTYDRGFDLATQ